MNKQRISKAFLETVSTEFREALEAVTARHTGIKSFTYDIKAGGTEFCFGEGEYTVLYGANATEFEMANSNNLGAAGLVHGGVGQRRTFPAGTIIMEVTYYAKYRLHVVNIGDAALPSPR